MAAPPKHVPAPTAANGDAFRLVFVGVGNLAESIGRGVAASGVLPASVIRTAPHCRPERGEVVDDSDVIIISVKPQIGTRNGPDGAGATTQSKAREMI